MKKSLVALAALAVVGAASAQSTVTLYGVVDLGYSFGNGSIANKAAMVSGNSSSSRLGFKGVEDLGGGLAANFQLEADVAPNGGYGSATNSNNQLVTPLASAGTQGLTFSRISTVGLAGNFGQVKLGRDYTPVFDIDGGFDPFAYNGVGNTLARTTATLAGATEVRSSNSIAYDIAVSGFQARVMYGLGQNANTATSGVYNTSSNGNYVAWRIGYAQGPVNVQLAASRLSDTVTATTPLTTGYTTSQSVSGGNLGGIPGDVTEIAFGASYDLGKIKPMFTYNRTNNDTQNLTASNYLLGLSAPIGAGSLLASYNRGSLTGAYVGTIDKLAVGYVYNMSKRTAVYGTLATLRNADGAAVGLNGATTAANERSNGLDIGIKHSF